VREFGRKRRAHVSMLSCERALLRVHDVFGSSSHLEVAVVKPVEIGLSAMIHLISVSMGPMSYPGSGGIFSVES
jgi:hypothetical protein